MMMMKEDGVPLGYLFSPADRELVVNYLQKKINNEVLPCNKIQETTVYGFTPEDLAGMYRSGGEKEFYFFTRREKMHENGSRATRIVKKNGEEIGHWKKTSKPNPVFHKNIQVGLRHTLVYRTGKKPDDEKTSWIMQEYIIDAKNVNEWALCKIYWSKHNGTNGVKRKASDEESSAVSHDHYVQQRSSKIRRISSEEESLNSPNIDPNHLRRENGQIDHEVVVPSNSMRFINPTYPTHMQNIPSSSTSVIGPDLLSSGSEHDKQIPQLPQTDDDDPFVIYYDMFFQDEFPEISSHDEQIPQLPQTDDDDPFAIYDDIFFQDEMPEIILGETTVTPDITVDENMFLHPERNLSSSNVWSTFSGTANDFSNFIDESCLVDEFGQPL